PTGSVYVDGSGIGDIVNIVLRDPRILSVEGEVTVVVSINMKEFRISSDTDIISRGFVYMRESEGLINEAEERVTNHLNKIMDRRESKWFEIKNEIIVTIAPLLYEKTKRRPMILPIIMEV